MEATGTIVQGAIVLDQPIAFPEGTRVAVRVEPARAPAEILASIAALPLNEGPEFSGKDHDQILYGDSCRVGGVFGTHHNKPHQ